MLNRQALGVASDCRSAGVKAVFANSGDLSPLVSPRWPGLPAGGLVVDPQARLGDCRRSPELDDVDARFRVVCGRLDGFQAALLNGPRISQSNRAVGQEQGQEQAACMQGAHGWALGFFMSGKGLAVFIYVNRLTQEAGADELSVKRQ